MPRPQPSTSPRRRRLSDWLRRGAVVSLAAVALGGVAVPASAATGCERPAPSYALI